jgi:hypothetical protein
LRRVGLSGRLRGAGTGGVEWRSGEKIPKRASRHGDFSQLGMKAGWWQTRLTRSGRQCQKITPTRATCWGGAHRSNRPLSWHGRQLPRGGDVCAHETEATMRIGGGGGEMVATDIRGWCERKWSTSEPAAACGPCGSDRLGPIGGPRHEI